MRKSAFPRRRSVDWWTTVSTLRRRRRGIDHSVSGERQVGHVALQFNHVDTHGAQNVWLHRSVAYGASGRKASRQMRQWSSWPTRPDESAAELGTNRRPMWLVVRYIPLYRRASDRNQSPSALRSAEQVASPSAFDV